ncbi:MAG TPA: hypothetical protein VH642_12775 [Streptosporangiaceae bacterium]
MCKPGSASSGGGAASTGLGLAVVVLGAVGAVSMAAAVISTFLTAVLVTLIGMAAAGSILLAVQLYRTRGVMARPVSRRPPLARGRIQPARPRSAVGTAARAAIPARQPLAIEAPAPVHARIGVPAASGGLAMARLTARWPADVDGGPVPDLLLPADVDGSILPDLLLPADVDGSTVPELLLPADRQQALAASAEDVVTTR